MADDIDLDRIEVPSLLSVLIRQWGPSAGQLMANAGAGRVTPLPDIPAPHYEAERERIKRQRPNPMPPNHTGWHGDDGRYLKLTDAQMLERWNKQLRAFIGSWLVVQPPPVRAVAPNVFFLPETPLLRAFTYFFPENLRGHGCPFFWPTEYKVDGRDFVEVAGSLGMHPEVLLKKYKHFVKRILKTKALTGVALFADYISFIGGSSPEQILRDALSALHRYNAGLTTLEDTSTFRSRAISRSYASLAATQKPIFKALQNPILDPQTPRAAASPQMRERIHDFDSLYRAIAIQKLGLSRPRVWHERHRLLLNIDSEQIAALPQNVYYLTKTSRPGAHVVRHKGITHVLHAPYRLIPSRGDFAASLRPPAIEVIPDGCYIFLIEINNPVVVKCLYVGPYVDGATRPGHTSENFADGDNINYGVLFAGELGFRNGALIFWSNASGHFVPPTSILRSHLLSPVRDLLPLRLFSDIESCVFDRHFFDPPSIPYVI